MTTIAELKVGDWLRARKNMTIESPLRQASFCIKKNKLYRVIFAVGYRFQIDCEGIPFGFNEERLDCDSMLHLFDLWSGGMEVLLEEEGRGSWS